MSERQIEMWWRCSSCGHRNLGRHGVCQQCANPKDGSEAWELPEDTASAPSVTDPALLALAKGGPDWRCGFCGSDQRAHDGSCRECGAGRSQPEPTSPPPARPQPSPVGRSSGCGLFLLMLGALVTLGAWWGLEIRRGFTDVEVVVDEVAWTHSALLERRKLVEEQGFRADVPSDSLELKSAGTRVHHTNSVPDGWTTETYEEAVPDGTRRRAVTEVVSDGDDVSHVSERVRCGDDCEPGPESCHETCRPNGNGFATCKTECTRGPERCTPKWCNETRTVSTPKTRTVTSTIDEPATKLVTRTRKVQAWREEPVREPYFTWKAWRWVPVEDVVEQGVTFETRLPIARGHDVRLSREKAAYTVVFKRRLWWPFGAQRWTWHPDSFEAFSSFASGAAHRLRVRGSEVLSIDPA